MSLSRKFSLMFVSVVTALLLIACNETSTDPHSGTPGAGDFEVSTGVRYGDTAYTANSFFGAPGGVLLQSFDSLRADFSRVDTLGYMVQGGSFSHVRGDSTYKNVGTSVQVYVGARPAASATYDVRGNWAHYSTPKSGMAGKVSIYVGYLQNGELDWSHPDSSAGAKVKVVVTADSIQVLGKNIKLKSGKLISFNLTTKKTWNP